MKPFQLQPEHKPARVLGRGRPGKQIHYFPSLKNGSAVVCESQLEKFYCLWLEFDERVLSYAAQPETVRYLFEGSPRSYTPDFLVNYQQGSERIEVKPVEIRQDQEFLRRFEAKQMYYQREGKNLKLVTSDVIRRRPLIDNLSLLYHRLHQLTACPYDQVIRSLPSDGSSITLARLKKTHPELSMEWVYYSMFYGHISSNMHEKPINLETTLSRLPPC
jgi:hypothetical protein